MSQTLDLNKLLPSYLRNEVLSSLVSNLFNRFVSDEQSVLIAGQIGNPLVAGEAVIKESNLERQENALIPGLYFKAGTEQYLFTFNDLINKINTLDIDIVNLRSWIAEQTFNYSPPIDYDRFVNYTNYYWVGSGFAAGTGPAWNVNNLPEYYTIARPKPTDSVKMPVQLATTSYFGNINLYFNDRSPETFTLTFTSPTTFTVTSNLDSHVTAGPYAFTAGVGVATSITLTTSDAGTSAPNLYDDGVTRTVDLITFTITNGVSAFASGDVYSIYIEYFTSNVIANLTSTNQIGKGSITGVSSIYTNDGTEPQAMHIDGVAVSTGDRILVKNQTDPRENGIYIATAGAKWQRAPDMALGQSYTSMTVYIEPNSFTSQGGTTWTFTSGVPAVVGTDEFPFTSAGVLPIPVNDWQIHNYWIHQDDIPLYADLGYSIDTSTQAQCPIVEYLSTVQLNAYVDGNGNPASAATNGVANIPQAQVKTRFNQIPLFDLFRYDGTHAGMTSGIWFYAESPNYTTDPILLRRVITTSNDDYVFGAGVSDSAGRILYWKNNGNLTSIWQPGAATAQASTPLFFGAANRGTLNITMIASDSDTQQWTATATSPTTFNIVGSRSGNVGVATVNAPFIADEVELTLNVVSGNTPFAVGEYFTFNVYAPTTPRYIEQLSDGSIVNFPGGYAADHASSTPVGAWLTPSRMFQNINRETREQIAFGDFLNHGISVIAWQEGFTGSAFGDNNVRSLTFNPGFGGQIREFGSNFPLLASMLIEQDLSPITILDFAEQQYSLALASIDQFLLNNLATYFASVGSIETTTINPSASDILALEAYFEQLRGKDVNLSTTFSDTTSGIVNWPATLPQIGLLAKVVPGIKFDYELNSAVIVYHDGHTAVIATDNPDFDIALVQSIVPRSDGTKSPGIFSETAPSEPYARQLWMKPSTFTIYIFDVDYDTVAAPSNPTSGQYWYIRSTNTLLVWTGTWSATAVTVASRWIPINTSAIRNSLVLAIENKLYSAVHPQQQINLDITATNIVNSPYAELELAQFSAEYNYDTFAPDYDPGNAFTWNYKQATIPLLPTPPPARWYDIYKAYFASFGFAAGVTTDRPDIEPWKLMGFPSEPATWASTYAAPSYTIVTETTATWLATSNVTLIGLQTIDGNFISTGDRVLCVGQSLPQFNGLYVAGAGGWSRTGTMSTGLAVTITSGFAWNNTVWILTTSGTITVGTTPLMFNQVRTWLPAMWAAIKTANPTMQLCVNVNTDGLIPPYVSPTQFASAEALITTIPAGVNLGYAFGDDGPIELVWKKSLEYNYGLARSYFRLFPLQFLDSSWGETYITAGSNLRVERNLQASLPSSKFLLHGERLNLINNYTPAETAARFFYATNAITWTTSFTGTVVFEVTHTANTGAVGPLGMMGPSSTVFNVYVNGVSIGLAYEGVPFTFSSQGVSYTNVTILDLGIPYEMGDTLTMTFEADTITTTFPTSGTDFTYGVLGCEGCVADSAQDPTAVITDIHNQPVFSFSPGQTKIFNGVGQWFTNLLRYTYIDTDVSLASLAYRGWNVNLVHRLGALIRPDSMDINTSQGDIPTTGYDIILRRATNTSDLWITALRVQLVQMGTRVLTPSGLYIPAETGADWIFRVSGYNSANPQVDYYTLNTSGPYQTFTALGGAHTTIAWNNYTDKTGTATTTLPLQITGVQNVINFLYGYTDYVQDQGFIASTSDTPMIDQETGRKIDWQLEIEKFIDQVYAGQQAGSAYSLNPFMNALYLQTPIGLMGRYTNSMFIDVASTQACYDVTGTAIPINSLRIIRTDEQAVTYSPDIPIYSAHLFTDQFEHAIIFNGNFTADSTSELIFDSFLGEYMSTAYLTFTSQENANGKPTFDGFYLLNNTAQTTGTDIGQVTNIIGASGASKNSSGVARNMVSSAAQISNFYDAGQTFNDPITAQNAMALLGFQTKDYFNNLNVGPATQLDFWRGMIHAKGTDAAVNAFTNYKAFSQASVDEYWAYKLATYGDARENTSPEIKINPADCAQSYTQLQFYSASDPAYLTNRALPLYIQVEADDDSRWYTLDDLGTLLRFDSQTISEKVIATGAGYYVTQNIYHNGDSFAPTVTGPGSPRIVTAQMIYVTQAGTYTVSGYTWLNKTKFSPIQLYDYVASTLDQEITLWHPAIGIHAYESLETINMITSVDPAHYNYTTNTTNNENYLALKPWADREVGRVWWDTSNLAYIPYYDATIFPDRQTRQTRWGSLADYASIDLYVWTKSSYPPSEYNARAALQAGDSSIDPSVRLSGTVGFAPYYSASRVITITPIAWSEAGVGNGNAHPAFDSPNQAQSKIWISGISLIMDVGRLADADIVAGRNLGAWNALTNVPVSECSIGTTVTYDIGSSLNGPGAPVLLPGNSNLTSITVSGIANSSIFGTQIGELTLSSNYDGTSYYLVLTSSSGFTQSVQVAAFSTTQASSTIVYTFDQFGLQVSGTTTQTTISAANLVAAFVNASNDIYVRECVSYTPIVDFPSNTGTTLDNNTADNPPSEYGWKTWVVPTQAQLSADLIPPNNQWLPYIGTPVTISVTGPVAAAMASSANTWTLPTGITINRYASSWTPWVQLKDTRISIISNGSSYITFTVPNQTSLNSNNLSVYANGTQLNPSGYVISNNLVQIVNTPPEGTTLLLLYRAYQPTAADLSFDPTVSDNPTIQTWYKQDYQYTQLVQRDSTGAITGTNYYFWVTGKTDPLPNQSFNLVEAAENLQTGEDQYMLFSRMVADSSSESGAGYDSCAIYGLGTQVTAVNTYKLRFLRDFTLRNDPDQLKLKNVHTEWTLIRKNQSSKIPSQLWTVLTNAACGQDAGGNALPSQVRIDYDNRYGTQTQFGFGPGQIFAPTQLILDSIINTILNTSVTITLGATTIIDYITALNITPETTEVSLTSTYFSTPGMIRSTMSLIFSSARAPQINEIFFNALDIALASNYQMTDLFKTSMLTLSSSTVVSQQNQSTQINDFY